MVILCDVRGEHLLQDVKEVGYLLVNGPMPVGHQHIWKREANASVLIARQMSRESQFIGVIETGTGARMVTYHVIVNIMTHY